jgi:hypothetical protein
VIAVSLVAAALFFAADPTPAPVPPMTLQNVAVPDLPEIGRVRASTPSCAILRDLLIPSVNAAKRADDRFAILSTTGPAYAGANVDRDVSEGDLSLDPRYGSDAPRQLAHMDQALSVMIREANVIATALKDPRFATNSDDPKVAAELAQLNAVFDVQAKRANLLNEFVMRENIADVKRLSQSSALNTGGRRGIAPNTPAGTHHPAPSEGLPDLHGDPRNDALAMYNWYRSLNAVVHATEYTAATAFLDIAKECK